MPTLVQNKKAHLDYEVLEEFDAGAELLGFEVKALRGKRGKLLGARVIVRGGEAFLIGASIPPYQAGNTPDSYEPERNRRLLLTKKELVRLGNAESTKGLTVIPLSWYTKGKKVKLSLAIVRGKKKYDKRETLKKRDTDREMRRTLKSE